METKPKPKPKPETETETEIQTKAFTGSSVTSLREVTLTDYYLKLDQPRPRQRWRQKQRQLRKKDQALSLSGLPNSHQSLFFFCHILFSDCY